MVIFLKNVIESGIKYEVQIYISLRLLGMYIYIYTIYLQPYIVLYAKAFDQYLLCYLISIYDETFQKPLYSYCELTAKLLLRSKCAPLNIKPAHKCVYIETDKYLVHYCLDQNNNFTISTKEIDYDPHSPCLPHSPNNLTKEIDVEKSRETPKLAFNPETLKDHNSIHSSDYIWTFTKDKQKVSNHCVTFVINLQEHMFMKFHIFLFLG